MRIPRNVDGEKLTQLLSRFGYEVTRQTGSHIRVTTTRGGEHHLTISEFPRSKCLKSCFLRPLTYLGPGFLLLVQRPGKPHTVCPVLIAKSGRMGVEPIRCSNPSPSATHRWLVQANLAILTIP
jgi:predicted RNA binding protein YcfA (HicA-like mRNA interferase family)